MGNAASVSPNESDDVKKGKQPKPQQRQKDSAHEAPAASKPPCKRRSVDTIIAPKAASTDTDAQEPVKPSAVDSSPPVAENNRSNVAESARKGATSNADDEPDIVDGQDDSEMQTRKKLRKSRENEVDGGKRKTSSDDREREETRGSNEGMRRRGGPRDETASEETSSGSSDSGSYTSSSYTSSGRLHESDGDISSDDTFFVPEGHVRDNTDEEERRSSGGRGVVVRVLVDGDREDTDHALLPDSSQGQTVQDQKEKTTAKPGKQKRKRPAHRHHIKDETMRTLFGLVPFYGGDDGPMDQMVKATLASVGPNNIDVRNEAGDTLLILACQHACEDLVEPILAKGANPMAMNAVGICPLHYTCFADSLSFDAAEALLWRGADPNAAETTYGCTPLHYAASSGDAEICALLVEHGALAQTRDYYSFTAVKYAKDSGHEAVVDLLGGEEGGEGWVEMEDLHTGMCAGKGEEDSKPTGGLWIRHTDPQTELAYYMNDETGESWWATDLMAVAKEFLASAPSDDGHSSKKNGAATSPAALPPLGVREWLVQEQVRSWLVAIFSRVDPLRLLEVDIVLQIGKANFKEMLKALVLRYGLKELQFLRRASSPKLEVLGALALIPSDNEVETGGDGKASSTPPTPSNDKNAPEIEGRTKTEETSKVTAAAPVSRRRSSSPSAVGGVDGGQEGESTNNSCGNSNINVAAPTATSKSTLQRAVSSQHNLKGVDSPATIRAEAEKVFQEKVSQQEKELAEERKRQKNVLDDQGRTLQNLEGRIQKRKEALDKTKQEAEEALSGVVKLQSTLANDDAAQAASDALSEEIASLKAGLAAESVRVTHIKEALEATKGSAEERAVKLRAQEEERQVRLDRLRSDNEEEVRKIRTDAAESLSKAEQAWETERAQIEGELTKKLGQETTMLKETVEGAEKVLAEAAATTKIVTEASKEGAAKIEEARAWMKDKAEAHANTKHIDHANKQLHTSLRREMERAKQLHNQIEDMKGQARTYALVRPMDALEKEAGCKEVCLRDGKKTLAFLTAAKKHWEFTHVFQNPSAEAAATAAGQTELHKEVAGLGTTLADGHNVLIMAVGASRSGKTLNLVGEPDEAAAGAGNRGYFVRASDEDGKAETKAAPAPSRKVDQGETKKGTKKGKGKGGVGGMGGSRGVEESLGDGGGGVAAKTTPLAGIFPRLMAETFATLDHRVSQCAFIVWVSAAAVSTPAAPESASGSGDTVESLLPSADSLPPVRGENGEQVAGSLDDEVAEKLKEERDPDIPPGPPPEHSLWGRAVAASSPQKVMEIVREARSRASSPSATSEAGSMSGMREERHFLLRVHVELVNRSTKEVSSCEMVIAELAEEKPGDAWPAALAEIIRAHSTVAAGNSRGSQAEGFLGMVRGCLVDTAKVVTLLCMSPADNQAEKTERLLRFGKDCENSTEDGAAQLKDLKKELARLKKEAKGSAKKTAPSQLPRPAGGKRP